MSETASLAVFAVGAGAATFFSPCAYALLPAYLAYFTTQADGTPGIVHATERGVASALGALLAFAALGAIGVAIGQTLMTYFPVLEFLVGLALIVLGVSLLADRGLDPTIPLYRPSGSLHSFVAFGAGYAAAGAGCVAPVFLAVIVAAIAAPTRFAVATLAIYAVTFAGLLLALTLVGAFGIELAHGRLRRAGHRLTLLAGGVMIIGGAVQLAIALGWVPPPF